MTTTTCSQEDRQGRVCRLGVGHRARCRFGAMKLTPLQYDALIGLHNGQTEVYAPSSPTTSLVTLGLASRRFIGMRWWRFTLTPAGLEAVESEREG